MCLEESTLEEQQLTRLEKPMESESQQALEEDEALKANDEGAPPISDDEEVEEREDVQGNIEPEASYQAEWILAETSQPSIHNHTLTQLGLLTQIPTLPELCTASCPQAFGP